MALDLRLQQKMSQQLVMTPQLQQAIKLLQLNHLELSEVLAKEMEENPMLEDGQNEERSEEVERLEGIEETVVGETPERASSADDGDSQTASDLQSVMDSPVDATPEPTNKEKESEIDWESYLESNTYALPATAGGHDELPPFEASLSKSESLHDHLRWQVQMGAFSEKEKAIAAMLIEEVNDDGYLSPDAVEIVAEEMELEEDEVLSVLRMLQQFDPRGVAARNLRECLLLQVEDLAEEQPLMVDIIDRHLPNVEKRNYQAIVKDLNTTLPELGEAIKAIAQLEPRPGRLYSDQEPRYITPDIYVVRVGDGYEILLNEDGLPKLKISNYYRDALQSSNGKEKNFIQDKLRGAVWLIRSIHMRQRTIYKVVESILKFQADFFEKGVAHLKPLILKDVAEDVGMHESTISRVTSNKYVHCPQGTYELKYFFNSSIARSGGDSIASESVRDRIKTIISEEDPSSPVSDQQIVKILKGHDINIARRTVAKYREMLKIPPSSKRKKVF